MLQLSDAEKVSLSRIKVTVRSVSAGIRIRPKKHVVPDGCGLKDEPERLVLIHEPELVEARLRMLSPPVAGGEEEENSSSSAITAAAASTAAVSMAEESNGEFHMPARDSGSGSHLDSSYR